MGAPPRFSRQRLLGKRLDSTLFMVIRRIYRVLWIQEYCCDSRLPKSFIKPFTIRLISHVRESVHKSFLDNLPNLDIDWESRVFRPTIATLDLTDIVDVCEADAEYMLLLSTTLALAFELLLLAGNSEAARLRTFLARAFEKYFVEPNICILVENVLEIEQKRLAKACVNVQVLRTIQHVRGLLPDIELCTAAWKMQLTSQKSRRSLDTVFWADGKDCMSRPLMSRRRMSSIAKPGSTEMHYPTS